MRYELQADRGAGEPPRQVRKRQQNPAPVWQLYRLVLTEKGPAGKGAPIKGISR